MLVAIGQQPFKGSLPLVDVRLVFVDTRSAGLVLFHLPPATPGCIDAFRGGSDMIAREGRS
jgi:hypothetical protein